MATKAKFHAEGVPLVKQIAGWALDFDSAEIPPEVMLQAKLIVLDSIGCALAAREEAVYLSAARALNALGGAEECTVIGYPRRVPLTHAVMLNGILIRALDLNDLYVGPGQPGHPSDNIAVALSASEQKGNSGREALASVALGYEIYCRLLDVAALGAPWDHVTASALAAPAMAGRLLGLTRDQVANALALSALHGNTLAAVRFGQLSNAKAMANAFVAQQATLCALLALNGATGPLAVIEGKSGLSHAFLAGADLAALVAPVKDRFKLMEASIKAYPCIGTAQAMISGVLRARAGIQDPSKEIQQVELRMADIPFVRGQIEDSDRRWPASRETADHSFYYLAAVALLDDELGPCQFEDDRWLEPATRAMMDRIVIRADPDLNGYTPGSYPCVVRVVLEGGRDRTVEVFYPAGHPRNPLSSAGVEAKFRNSTRSVISKERQSAIISKVEDLDKLASMRDLMRDLVPGDGS